MDNFLREQVKLLKVMQSISYKELASYLEISTGSFYNWVNGYYSLGNEKQSRLLDIIQTIKE